MSEYVIIQSIISRRNELSISQRELAKLVGMQQPAICRLEKGDGNIKIGTLLKVSDALNMEVEFKPRSLAKV